MTTKQAKGRLMDENEEEVFYICRAIFSIFHSNHKKEVLQITRVPYELQAHFVLTAYIGERRKNVPTSTNHRELLVGFGGAGTK